MLIFLHMHKCAGSTVVKKAKKSGFTLAWNHSNGNLVDAAGNQIKYEGTSRARLKRIVNRHRRKGVNFFAIEWDFPPIEYFDEVEPVDLFTVLREPFSRAQSNFVFAKVKERVDPALSFRDFMNMSYTREGPTFRSANYFVRKVVGEESTVPLTELHLKRAIDIMERFAAVVVLGHHDLDAELAKLGITSKVPPAKKMGAGRLKPDLPPECLSISDADKAWFLAENTLDRQLVEHFQRPMRLQLRTSDAA